jgi:c-di-AMP phosphodiesterase-like protein
MNTRMKLKAHKILSILTIAIGLVLMIAKIYADSEPGAIPLLLVVLGMGWYFITRVRTQSHRK